MYNARAGFVAYISTTRPQSLKTGMVQNPNKPRKYHFCMGKFMLMGLRYRRTSLTTCPNKSLFCCCKNTGVLPASKGHAFSCPHL